MSSPAETTLINKAFSYFSSLNPYSNIQKSSNITHNKEIKTKAEYDVFEKEIIKKQQEEEREEVKNKSKSLFNICEDEEEILKIEKVMLVPEYFSSVFNSLSRIQCFVIVTDYQIYFYSDFIMNLIIKEDFLRNFFQCSYYKVNTININNASNIDDSIGESLEEVESLIIKTFDNRAYKIYIQCNEDKYILYNLLNNMIFPLSTQDIYAFKYSSRLSHFSNNSRFYNDNSNSLLLKYYNDSGLFENKMNIQFTHLNSGFKLCSSYPEILFLPVVENHSLQSIHEDLLDYERFFSLFINYRIPILTYYNHKLSSSIWISSSLSVENVLKVERSEMEKVGLIRNFSNMLRAFLFSIHSKKVIVYLTNLNKDKTNFFFGLISKVQQSNRNRQNLQTEDLYSIETYKPGLLDLDDLFKLKLRYESVFSIESRLFHKNYLVLLEKTGWLHQISLLLKISSDVVEYIMNSRSILLVDEYGVDRTIQISSIVQVLLHNKNRTIKGFLNMIEKEWIINGHPFGKRSMNQLFYLNNESKTSNTSESSMSSPVFIQFLDCIYQIQLQFPFAFEFNENLLILLSNIYRSNKYGNFLFNSIKEMRLYEKTISFFKEIEENTDVFLIKNLFFKEKGEYLLVQHSLFKMKLWKGHFFQYSAIGQEELVIKRINDINYKQKEIEISNLLDLNMKLERLKRKLLK